MQVVRMPSPFADCAFQNVGLPPEKGNLALSLVEVVPEKC